MPDEIVTPQPRHRADRWPQRLGGHAVRAVEARGKHLLVRFEGDLTLHSHLRMSGLWVICREGERWRRAAGRAWLVMRCEGWEVVQFDGPVLELMSDFRARTDRASPRSGRMSSARTSTVSASSPACGRATRHARSATRCSTSGYSPASAICGRRSCASPPRSTHGGASLRSPTRRLSSWSRWHAAHATVAQQWACGAAACRIQASWAAVPPLRDDRSPPRAGGEQPHDVLVPWLPALSGR